MARYSRGAGGSVATQTPIGYGSGKLTIRGCPGPFGNAENAGVPTVILTTNITSGEARVGDLVQAQLPADMRWSFTSASSNLALVAPGGLQDQARNVCVWNFRARASGSAMARFTGTALCEPNVACPQYAALADFSVSIT